MFKCYIIVKKHKLNTMQGQKRKNRNLITQYLNNIL